MWNRVLEPFVYWGQMEVRALQDTFRHIKAQIGVSLVLFVLASIVKCRSLPKGTACDVSDLEAGLIAVGAWLGVVFLFNLGMAPVRFHREQRVEAVAIMGARYKALVRSFLAHSLAGGNLLRTTISLASFVEGEEPEERTASLEQARKDAAHPETLAVLEAVVSKPSNGAADILLTMLDEWRNLLRGALKEFLDPTYVALFDSEAGLQPPPPDVQGVYSPCAKRIHYYCQRLEQFMKDFRDA
jgi:hypothetical protein